MFRVRLLTFLHPAPSPRPPVHPRTPRHYVPSHKCKETYSSREGVARRGLEAPGPWAPILSQGRFRPQSLLASPPFGARAGTPKPRPTRRPLTVRRGTLSPLRATPQPRT